MGYGIAFLIGGFAGAVFVGGYAYLRGVSDGHAKAVQQVRELVQHVIESYSPEGESWMN